ncbi:hypothetical protein CR513_57333, partial [Mucuna pruriens]
MTNELSGLKGVLLGRIMKGNTNRMMLGMSIEFEDEILGLLLFNSLPKSWMTFKVSITNSASNGVVSLQMVNGSVLNEEMRRKAQGSSSQFEIQECGVSLLSQNMIYTEALFLVKKENKAKKGKSKEKDDDRVMILSFFETESGDFGVLKMGNDGVTKVIGVGDVCLQTNTRMQLWLKGVKHAPDVRFNMISVHMLDDGGYDDHFGNGKWKLTKGKLVVARGEKISKLYWTKALVVKDSVNAMDMEASLWHRRLSHISEKRLNCLAKKDMLPRLKNAELEKCSHCMAGKQTRKLLVNVLKTKDQVLEKFKHFQALVERQSGKKRFGEANILDLEILELKTHLQSIGTLRGGNSVRYHVHCMNGAVLLLQTSVESTLKEENY